MIELRKPVRRRLTLLRTGLVTVELAPEGIRYREYGARRWLTLPHGRAFQEAAQLEADRIRAERRARRALRTRGDGNG